MASKPGNDTRVIPVEHGARSAHRRVESEGVRVRARAKVRVTARARAGARAGARARANPNPNPKPEVAHAAAHSVQHDPQRELQCTGWPDCVWRPQHATAAAFLAAGLPTQASSPQSKPGPAAGAVPGTRNTSKSTWSRMKGAQERWLRTQVDLTRRRATMVLQSNGTLKPKVSLRQLTPAAHRMASARHLTPFACFRARMIPT